MIGVECFYSRDKHGKIHKNFKLVIAYATDPKYLSVILYGEGLSYGLGLKQLNKVCEIIAKVTECPNCLQGSIDKEIVAEGSGKNVTYRFKQIALEDN